MFRKTLAAALTIALVSGASITASSTPAAAGNGKGLAVAAVVGGIAGALIASASSKSSHDQGYQGQGYRGHAHGYQSYGYRDNVRPVGFRSGYVSQTTCFDKPIVKWDRFTHQQVLVGYKPVCR